MQFLKKDVKECYLTKGALEHGKIYSSSSCSRENTAPELSDSRSLLWGIPVQNALNNCIKMWRKKSQELKHAYISSNFSFMLSSWSPILLVWQHPSHCSEFDNCTFPKNICDMINYQENGTLSVSSSLELSHSTSPQFF